MRELTREHAALVSGGRGLVNEQPLNPGLVTGGQELLSDGLATGGQELLNEDDVDCFCGTGSGSGSGGGGSPGSGGGGSPGSGTTNMGTIIVYGSPSPSHGSGTGLLSLYTTSSFSGSSSPISRPDPDPEPDPDESEEEKAAREERELQERKAASKIELEQGVIGENTRKLLIDKKLKPEEVLGKNVIVLFEFDVSDKGINLPAEHKHYVYVDGEGHAKILSGNKGENGKLGVHTQGWLDSGHSPTKIVNEQRFKVVMSGPKTAEAWEKMEAKAKEIEKRELPYFAISQNSNSVARTLANAGGVPLPDLPGGGSAPGLNNDLNNEIQAPPREFSSPSHPLLVGARPIPDVGNGASAPSDTPTGVVGTDADNTPDAPAPSPVPAPALATPPTPEEIAEMLRYAQTPCGDGTGNSIDVDDEAQHLPDRGSPVSPTMPQSPKTNCR